MTYMCCPPVFTGNIGVARDEQEPTNSIPPGIWAGNMDNRRLTAGTTLYVPVSVELMISIASVSPIQCMMQSKYSMLSFSAAAV